MNDNTPSPPRSASAPAVPVFAPPSMRTAAGPSAGRGRPSWPAPSTPKPSAPSPGMRFAWLVPGALLAVAALVWGTFNILTVLAHEVRTEQSTFAAAEVAAVDITSENGSVRLTGGATDEITVTAKINDGWKESDVEMRIVGGVLEIRGSCPILGNPWCNTDFTVTLPADVPVRVDASNGNVDASGLRGGIDLDTDNGHVEIADVSGAIRITNDNGRIVGRRIGVANVDASTHNGRIVLAFSEPPDSVYARSRNGRIEVSVPDDAVAYRVNLATDNGSQNIGVRTDPASAHSIDLATRNGSVSVHRPG